MDNIAVKTQGKLKKRNVEMMQKSPVDRALINLKKALSQHHEIQDVKFLVEKYSRMPNIYSINPKLFALTLAFMVKYPNPSPEEFKDQVILPYIDRLISDKQNQELILKYKESILRYVILINDFDKMLKNK